ncbi:hypothetical protein ElyMa_001690200 [Elysia marginata]|uniref:Reverse transcriptase domain-containing protein n=1 Tax=Elysia marginata TaxID=1093978 RepID=A0AAV4JU90_9GAST|nr:hypothetical protein ElyMa_001690200 [Elysia marginata]
MLFADDAALMSHTKADLQELVNRPLLACKESGLTIWLNKTNILAQGTDTEPDITTDNLHLKIVEVFNCLGITWQDKVTNIEIFECSGIPSQFALRNQKRLKGLAGHVHPINDGRNLKDILYGNLREGSRSRGRPQLRFTDVCPGHEGSRDWYLSWK